VSVYFGGEGGDFIDDLRQRDDVAIGEKPYAAIEGIGAILTAVGTTIARILAMLLPAAG
jgi:hypothetical protein